MYFSILTAVDFVRIVPTIVHKIAGVLGSSALEIAALEVLRGKARPMLWRKETMA